MTIKEFLYTYKEGIIYTEQGPAAQDKWGLAAGRKLIIPDYQREYRWEEKQLSELMEDISSGNCYLGQIAVSHNIHTPAHYFIVDGQQRITSVIILLTVLCRQFFLENDGDNIKNYELHLSKYNLNDSQTSRLSFEANCFQDFQSYISQIYQLTATDDKGFYNRSQLSSPKKDSYRQAERYIEACSIFSQIIDNQLKPKKTRSEKMRYVKDVIQKILDTQISVVIFEGDSSYECLLLGTL